ncbi:MAG TPA: tetratricopeptide repeat protein, partial [Pyrinomonadaceae bacterium]|nr:tetratricopeptide repeat protein [Pyrinomonadaceae bacterium]
MPKLSRAFQLVLPPPLLLLLLFVAPSSNRIQAGSGFHDLQVSPQPTWRASRVGGFAQASEQSRSSAEALAEAGQLSLTVVKLFKEGKYDEALPLAKRALALREAALGPDHEIVQGSLLNLAELYTVLKKYGEAQKILERLLQTHEQKVGPEDAGAAIFLDKLAFLTYAQRDFKKAEANYKRALAIREKSFGPNSAEFASSLYALAEFYR